MRVIGGNLRGRELRAPRGRATRPTTDRVREAWFNILADVNGARVLELYAGTGALGIEALSRGAAHAVFVEAWGPAHKVLSENLGRLGLGDQATVIRGRVEASNARVLQAGPYDLLLADPPWTELEQSFLHLERAIRGDLLTPGARLFIGHPSGSKFEPAHTGLLLVDRRAWGDSAASLFAWQPALGG